MEVLARIEGFLEAMFEGVFRRFSRGPTHPVEIARRIYRSMENERRVSVFRTYVPNCYRVVLSPDDMKSLSCLANTLSQELSLTVVKRAQRERYSFVGPVTVDFLEDSSLRPGSVRVEASFVEGETPDDDPTSKTLTELGDTRRFRVRKGFREPVERRKGPKSGSGFLVIGEGDGTKEFELTEARITIGRKASNDIVIGDGNVSREHAEIRHEGRNYVLRDLGSTNGTFVNGRRLSSEHVLEDGDILEVGKSRLVFKVR